MSVSSCFPNVPYFTGWLSHNSISLQVVATIIQQDQYLKDPEDIQNVMKSYNLAFWTAAAFGYFALIVAIPGLWGVGVLNKSGESARVEELVAHHHEQEVIGVREKQSDPEAK